MKNKKSLASILVTIAFFLVAAAYVLINPSTPSTPTPPAPSNATPIATDFAAPISNLDAIPAALHVELFSFPETDEKVLLDRIANAKSRVWMKMYLLTDFRVVDALAQAHKNGANVRAMIDQNPFGGGSSPKLAFEKLSNAGIDVKYSNPVFRFTHEKSFIIDNTLFVLTANMTKAAFSRNREFGVIHTDASDVAEAVAAYNADWTREKFVPSGKGALVWSPVNARPKLTQVVQAAQSTLLVYAELAQDDTIIAELIKAQKRGVKVRFLISPSSEGEDQDANKTDLDKMQRGKIKVRYLKSPYMHAKVFVADDALAYVGSINLSTGSMEFNRELGILIKDRTAIRLLDEIFEKDWSKATDR